MDKAYIEQIKVAREKALGGDFRAMEDCIVEYILELVVEIEALQKTAESYDHMVANATEIGNRISGAINRFDQATQSSEEKNADA